MPRISRTAALIAALAFALRLGVALVCGPRERTAHHFNDFRLVEESAWSRAALPADQRPATWTVAASQRVMVWTASLVYRAVGRRPLALAALAAAASAAWILGLWLLARRGFDERCADGTALAAARWPSAVFYGAQFIKDPLINGLFLPFMALAVAPTTPGAFALALTLAAAAALLRPMILIPAIGALLAAVAAYRRADRPRAALILALCVLLVGAQQLSSRIVFGKLLPLAHANNQDPTLESPIVPSFLDPKTREVIRPWTPRGIERYRNYRQYHDQVWSIRTTGRPISTQILPFEPIETWSELALFLPRVMFTALLQPLPGLYPLEDKATRKVAAAENAALLAVLVLAGVCVLTGGATRERLPSLVFFVLCAAGASLIEFDLGSSSRHKTLYFPLLFPFALEGARRVRNRFA